MPHGLFMFTGDHFPAFLAEYRRWAGDVPLHADLFAFYFYRRNLEDLTAWIVRILYENTDEAQNRIDLEGIQHDCIAAWPYFERDIARVQEQLGELRVVSSGLQITNHQLPITYILPKE